MTNYSRGNVILVNFIFTDDSGSKQRPALIISSDSYNQNRKEVIISAITSNTSRNLPGDHLIKSWKEAGLLYPSLATGIIRTISKDMIIRSLGQLSQEDMDNINLSLQKIFALEKVKAK